MTQIEATPERFAPLLIWYAGRGVMEQTARARETASLLEREHELGVLEDARALLLREQGSALLIEGAAGIGKTRLLAAATAPMKGTSAFVRTARAGELEREIPFGVARQLLEPLIERADDSERSRLLSGSAGLSLIAFGREQESPATEVDPFAPIHGLYWLLANLCDSRPVVLAIDDAHWADSQSLRWLDYVSRRVYDTPVLLVVAARTGEADEPAELEALREDASEVLRPSPLSSTGVEKLITAELEDSPSEEFSAACKEVTAGNPSCSARCCEAYGETRSLPTRRAQPRSGRSARNLSPATWSGRYGSARRRKSRIVTTRVRSNIGWPLERGAKSVVRDPRAEVVDVVVIGVAHHPGQRAR